MMQRTFDVTHEGTHYPTNAQLRRALNSVLDGVEIDGDVDYFLVENTSSGPSKVRATFNEGKPAKDDRTMTVGGRRKKATGGEAPDPAPEEGGKIDATEVLTSD